MEIWGQLQGHGKKGEKKARMIGMAWRGTTMRGAFSDVWQLKKLGQGTIGLQQEVKGAEAVELRIDR